MMSGQNLIKDRKGSVDLIQLVLVLPIFVLLSYGFFEAWKIVSVRQSLGMATYHAARCRSLYNDRRANYPDRFSDDPDSLDDDRFRCEWGLLHELVNNAFIDEEDLWGVQIRYRNANGDVVCVVTASQIANGAENVCPNSPMTFACDQKFDVEAALVLPWPIIVPGLPSRDMTFVSRHRSYIECPPTWQPTPIPIPTLLP